jgi:hypothetical protein
MSGGASLWEGIERSRNLSNTRLKELALEKHQLVLDFILFYCQVTSKGASSRKSIESSWVFPNKYLPGLALEKHRRVMYFSKRGNEILQSFSNSLRRGRISKGDNLRRSSLNRWAKQHDWLSKEALNSPGLIRSIVSVDDFKNSCILFE